MLPIIRCSIKPVPNDAVLPDWHHEKVFRLLARSEAAVAPLFSPGQEAERLHVVRAVMAIRNDMDEADATHMVKQVRAEH